MTRAKKAPEPERLRPMPPESVLDPLFEARFEPAPGLDEWVRDTFIAPAGTLHNPEHAHLLDARIGWLWASQGYVKQGRQVLGLTEDLMMAGRGNAWQRARAEQQMRQWFGDPPRFLITLDAVYCAQCTDAEFCALVEHELYHCGHMTDEFGEPAFTKDGQPKLGIRGHDVEEFVGVVRRYGVGDPDSSLARLVIAAASGAQVAPARIAHVCGTCLARA